MDNYKLVEILSCFMGCGTADVDFICNLFDRFDVEPGDAIERMQENEEHSANALISAIYECAIECAKERIDEEVDASPIDDVTEMCLNCSDSHLFINGEQIYGSTELRDVILSCCA